MKDQIKAHLNHPRELERLYRHHKTTFKQSFNALYPELKGDAVADSWHERLNYASDDINWGTGKDLLLVVIASLTAGLIAKLPALLSLDVEFFYTRNIGFIVFPLLTAYFAWKNRISNVKVAFMAAVTLACIIFINLQPNVKTSDTLVLSCIHLAFVLWGIMGFAFVGETVDDRSEQRLGFLKYNGDLVVMIALILIAGGIMTGITIGLFSLIGYHIEEFYFKNIVVVGLAATPIVATYLVQYNPQLVGRVSPVIAKLFGPLVVVMLTAYLIAIVYSGKDPYNDREFLLMFNLLLIGVMAIIFFSVAEMPNTDSRMQVWVLFLLALLTIIVNGIALSAILFRISAWGFTPNRTAVLGGNVLILINLLLVSWQLVKVIYQKTAIGNVGRSIARYLPVYLLWAIIVTFIFPLVFGFK